MTTMEGECSVVHKMTGKHLWRLVHHQVDGVSAFKDAGRERKARVQKAKMRPFMVGVLFALTLALGLTLNISSGLIQRLDPGCGVFISVLQYLFVVVRSLVLGFGGGEEVAGNRSARRRAYLLITAANTGSTILWNLSNTIGGPSFYPTFLTMCSGQIVLIMGAKVVMRGSRFSLGECFGALLMSLGMALVVSTGASGASRASGSNTPADDGGNLVAAAAVLFAGLFVLGIQKVLQESTLETFGQHGAVVSEMVFYQHLFGLPLLVADFRTLRGVVARWTVMEWRSLGAWANGVTIPPDAWLLLAFNIVANAAATTCLLTLVSETNSLVASLAVTLYRFGAILVSALVINAPPYPPKLMGLGCILVPAGSIVYLYCSSAKAAAETGAAKAKAA